MAGLAYDEKYERIASLTAMLNEYEACLPNYVILS